MQTRRRNRLSTALDHMPDGPIADHTLRVTGKLPEGVQSRELYRDVVHIAWPGFVELILTQLASMVDLMMVGSIGTGIVPPQYFGIVERFSVFAAVGFNAVLGWYLFNGFEGMAE